MKACGVFVVFALLNAAPVAGKSAGSAGSSGVLQVGTGPAIFGGRRVPGKHAAVEVVAAAGNRAVKLGGDATVSSSSFNLAKSIIGAGVLALPSGVAFFSDSPAALIPAIIMLTVMGVAAGYTFSLIGKTCAEHNVSTFKEAWSKSVGPNSAWVISTAITCKCFFASLVNSIIIGDSFTALAKSFGLPDVVAQRTNVILTLTAAVLLPLCSMKSLNALSPFSLLGLGGVLYTAVVMALRYFDGSYAAKGAFFEAVAAAVRPSFDKKGLPLLNVRAFVLLSMLSTSFIAHYNAPKFYAELKDTSLPRFNQVVKNAFGASTLIYAIMMAAGFLTFGGASGGFILNNFASNDALISFARFAIGLAIVTGNFPPRLPSLAIPYTHVPPATRCRTRTGYPFTFSALREGVLDLANVLEPEKRAGALAPLTLALLGVITAAALVLRDLGFVVSFSGAFFGAFIMFLCPAIMNIKNIQRRRSLAVAKGKGKKLAAKHADQAELLLSYGIVALGTTMGVLGASVTTLKALKKL